MDFYCLTTQSTLDQISRHCPESLSIYLQCVNRADLEGRVFFSRELVEVDMSEEWRPFRTNIKKLAREGLLEWHPIDNGIAVTLMGTDEDE